MTAPPLLALFDIDGTLLLRAADAHRDALLAALASVHGVTDPPKIAVAGRTDGEIARQILLRAGVSEERIEARADAVRDRACAEFAQRCPADLSEHVAPGIAELLEVLERLDDFRMSLVTGNFEPIARVKLRAAGIGRHFPGGQGGFGSDHEDRTLLPAIARRRAAAGDGAHPQTRTVVIGDTPRDIACAHADGVRCLAVATGPYEAGRLTEADTVVADAGELLEPLLALADEGTMERLIVDPPAPAPAPAPAPDAPTPPRPRGPGRRRAS